MKQEINTKWYMKISISELESPTVNPATKIKYLLKLYSEDIPNSLDRKCSIPISIISEILDIPERTVHRALDELYESGELEKSKDSSDQEHSIHTLEIEKSNMLNSMLAQGLSLTRAKEIIQEIYNVKNKETYPRHDKRRTTYILKSIDATHRLCDRLSTKKTRFVSQSVYSSVELQNNIIKKLSYNVMIPPKLLQHNKFKSECVNGDGTCLESWKSIQKHAVSRRHLHISLSILESFCTNSEGACVDTLGDKVIISYFALLTSILKSLSNNKESVYQYLTQDIMKKSEDWASKQDHLDDDYTGSLIQVMCSDMESIINVSNNS